MKDEPEALRRENDYLKRRCAQLQSDVDDLASQVLRMTQERDRLGAARQRRRTPDPLSGGQS